MALRHAVLAALVDGPATGYELAKWFDAGVANFWHATRPQLYAELAKLEAAGLVSGTEVVQRGRPNKRIMEITDVGVAALDEFARETSRPTAPKSDTLVKVRVLDVIDPTALREELSSQLVASLAKLEGFEAIEARMLRGRTHDEHLVAARRVGPYLTLRRGIAHEREYVTWLREVLDVIDRRRLGATTTRQPMEPTKENTP